MDNKKDQMIINCYHCGNQGLHIIQHRHKTNFGGPIFDEIGNAVDFEPDEVYEWILLSCPVCSRVTLLEDYMDNPEYTSRTYLYPANALPVKSIPDNIKRSFESAQKSKNIDIELCAMALRKTLELICIEKGAIKGSLEDKIKVLVSQGVFTQVISDVCDIIRKVGNQGAHSDGLGIPTYMVDELFEHMKLILSYFYALPVSVKALNSRMDKTAQRKKVSTDA